MAKGIKPASNLSRLDAFGSDKNDFDVLKHPAGDFITRVQKNLKKADKWLTGKTANLRIVQTDSGFDIVANESLEYLDKGVSGTETKYNTPYKYTTKMPPPKVFEDWIRRKNLNKRNNAKYKGKESPTKELTQDEQIESAAFAMAKSHQKHGQKPLNVYSSEIDQLKDEIKKEFKDFAVRTILNQLMQ
ncbi:MAG: hypothetical protein QM737_22655 [Ferruginibacter sp.]